ncbi:MAG: hypothetical protein J0L73_28425 [Verrucomicrobia bacterium]|nr:hypothetical protein [Verrucomicrobiota bacterium]
MSSSQKETVQSVLLTVYRALIGGGIAVGAWLANQVWTDVKALPQQLDSRVQHIEQTTAVLLDSRFTPADASRLKSEMSLELQKHEYRLTNVETMQNSMRSSLDRIEARLGTK